MICLRCGYCCKALTVIIVDDPEKGIVEGNLIEKECGTRCKHLLGEIPDQFSCAIHDYPWYDETPCNQYIQIERGNQPCRMGVHWTQLK